VQGPDVARRTALLVALASGAFTFSLIYSEGVLLTLGACGLLALVRRQWWLAGLVAALASFTSPLGLCLGAAAAASAVVAWRRRREYQALISVVLAPLGFVAYMVYLRIHTGTLTAWRRTERDGWKSYPSLKYPLHILWKFLSNPASPTLTGHLLFVGTVVTIVLVVIMVRAHLPAPVLWFGVSSVALSAVSAPIGLRPRFIMCAFPLVMGLAQRYDGPRFRIIAVTSAVLLALMTLEELSSFAVFP